MEQNENEIREGGGGREGKRRKREILKFMKAICVAVAAQSNSWRPAHQVGKRWGGVGVFFFFFSYGRT